MRRTLTKGTHVRVVNSDNIYVEEDLAKELGATDKFNKKKPRIGSTGDVMTVKDGYVLVDFGDYEMIVDIEGLEPQTRPSEIKLIARYMKNGAIE
jgi:hypothetical protein